MGLTPIPSITTPQIKGAPQPTPIKPPKDVPGLVVPTPQPAPPTDSNGVSRTFAGRELENPISFPTPGASLARGAKNAHIEQIKEILAHKLNSSNPENLKSIDFKVLADNISQIGGISHLDSATKEQLVHSLGIETDANLEMIQKIINDPRFNNLPETFTAMDILDICKKMKGKNIGDDEIMSTFLKPLFDNLDNVDNAKKVVIGACATNDIVFHEQLKTKENRCNPFISDKDVQAKEKDEEKPTSIAELKNQTVKVDQKNEGLIEVLAGLAGFNRKTESKTNILEMKLPRFIVDELKMAKTKEELEVVYKKYESIISSAMNKPGENQKPDETPKPEGTTAPPAIEENNIVTQDPNRESRESINSRLNSPEDIEKFLSTKKDSSLTYNEIKGISGKIINMGGLAAMNAQTKELVKTKLGIETDDNLKTINEIVSNPNFKELSKYIDSDKLLDICRTLKHNGSSDEEIKKVFLDGLLADLKNNQIPRAKEHIKDACRNSGIIFHEELHTKEYNSNPFLSPTDIQKLKDWENAKVSIVELSNQTTDTKRNNGGIIGAILGVVGANGSSRTTVDLAKIQLPRYIINELKNAENDAAIDAIVEKYKNIIKTALEVTKSK